MFRLDKRTKPLEYCSVYLVFKDEDISISYGAWLSLDFNGITLEFDFDWVDCSSKDWGLIAHDAIKKYLQTVSVSEFLSILDYIKDESYEEGIIHGKQELKQALKNLLL